MFRSRTILAIAATALAVAIAALPAFAQDVTPEPAPVSTAAYPQNTVTVTGFGTVHGAPDMATVDVGVDVFKPTVSEAFTEANTTIQAIIDALTGIGIAPEDIQTTNLTVYSTTSPNPENGNNERGYNVSNTVHVIVRDVNQVEDVIDKAIDAGATTLYGLSFSISDSSALESQARELAMQDAAARAGEYASLANATLGGVIVIAENQFGGAQPLMYTVRNVGGGANSVVSPGQSDVQVQVSVTYQLVR